MTPKQNGMSELEHNVNEFIKESRAGREELRTAITGVQAQTSELQKMQKVMADALSRVITVQERIAAIEESRSV